MLNTFRWTIFVISICLAAAVVRAQPSAFVREHFIKAHEQIGRGDFKGALVELNKIIKADPKFVYAYHYRGIVLSSLGDEEGAIRDFTTAIEINPDDSRYYSRRASSRHELNDFDGAIADYNQAIALDARYYNAYVGRGNVRRSQKDNDAAISDYMTALSLNPPAEMRLGIYLNLANTRKRKGDKEGAIVEYTKAIEEAELALRQSDFKYNKPLHVTSRTQREVARATPPSGSGSDDAPGASQPEYVKYVVQVGEDATLSHLYHNRGLTYQEIGNPEAAIADFSKALEFAPEDERTYNARGSALQEQGDLDGAISDFTKAIQLESDSSAFYANRGIALLLQGKDAKAQKDFDKSLKIDSSMKDTLGARIKKARRQREAQK